jgi:hypothetical protein|tara:strand:+ start:468 stop:719 length:252 start_codon:yes stop_codon:yes gene_type:complete
MAIEGKKIKEKLVSYLWDAAKRVQVDAHQSGTTSGSLGEGIDIHRCWMWIHGTAGNFQDFDKGKILKKNLDVLGMVSEKTKTL